MRRALLFLLSFSLFVPVFAQNVKGTWDMSTSTYRNPYYNLAWKLPSEITWIETVASGRNVYFKVFDPETSVTILFNVNSTQNFGSDVWKLYPNLSSQEYKNNLISGLKKNRVYVRSMQVTKSSINNMHTVKTITRLNKEMIGYGDRVPMVSISHAFLVNGHLCIASIEAMELVENSIDGFYGVVDLIFKGLKVGDAR